MLERSASPADYPVLHAPVRESTAVASFPHGTVFVFDHDLRYTHVGGEVLTALGVDRTAYVGKTLSEMFDAEAVATREPSYRLALAGNNVVLDAPLQDDRVLEMHLSPLFDRNGSVVAAMGYTLDVTELRRDALTLRDSEEQFRVAFEHAPIGMALLRTDGTLYRVNPALTRLFTSDEGELRGRLLQELTHVDDRQSYLDNVAALLADEHDTFEQELRYRPLDDGPDVWALLVCTVVRRLDARPSHLIAQITDISERRAAEAAAAAAREFSEAVLSASPDLIFVRHVDHQNATWTSRSLLDLLGYSPADIESLGEGLQDRVIPAEDRARFDAASLAVQGVEDGEVLQIRHRVRHADGSVRWLSRRLTPFRRDSAGRVKQFLGISTDITDVVQAHAELEHASLHDELTGLPNRRLIHQRLETALASAGPLPVVLFCDLDGFKQINDVHGHTVGDEVLVHVGAVLQTAVRPGDTVGRLGGDEFVLVLAVGSEESPAAVAQQALRTIHTALAENPLRTHAGAVCVAASVGISLPDAGSTLDDVLRTADRSMYEVKAGHSGGGAGPGVEPAGAAAVEADAPGEGSGVVPTGSEGAGVAER